MHWSFDVLIGVPVAVVAVVALVVVSGFFIRESRAPYSSDPGFFRFFGVAGLVSAFLVSGFVGVGLYPWHAEYHQWRPVSGTVSKVSQQTVSGVDGNGATSINQRSVIKLAGDKRLFGCDDPRCVTLRVGDSVSLSCLRKWVYAAVGGYDCRWVHVS